MAISSMEARLRDQEDKILALERARRNRSTVPSIGDVALTKRSIVSTQNYALVYTTVLWDDPMNDSGHFTYSAGAFTCVVPGTYRLTASLGTDQVASAAWHRVAILLNGSTIIMDVISERAVAGGRVVQGTVTRDLVAGDTIRVQSATSLATGALVVARSRTYVELVPVIVREEIVVAPTGGLIPMRPVSIDSVGGTAAIVGNKVTFSGVTSVSLNGVFVPKYTRYKLVYRSANTGLTVAATANVRLRAGGVDFTAAASYGNARTWLDTASTQGQSYSAADYFAFAAVFAAEVAVEATIFDPATAALRTMIIGSAALPGSTPGNSQYSLSGHHGITAIADGLSLFRTSGVATYNGEVQVWAIA